MLQQLKLKNVGPADDLDLELARCVNVITGDSGLGKSFLLDVMWWALTRTWARVPARPIPGAAAASISFHVGGEPSAYRSPFDRAAQSWTGKAGRPLHPGLVLYAQVDGAFSVWDPARNDWRKEAKVDVQDRPAAYRFAPHELWDGLAEHGQVRCNGLIRDWDSWQREGGVAFEQLRAALDALSPSDGERLVPGRSTRIRLDDIRDIPTVQTSYGKAVPVLHLGAAMKRAVRIAYVAVWAWREHLIASELRGREPVRELVLLIDEVEAHLDPRWQRTIVPSLLALMPALTRIDDFAVQLIGATHSAVVLASLAALATEDDAVLELALEARDARAEVVLRRSRPSPLAPKADQPRRASAATRQP